jgi:tetratricopeptide (TPR) repeat protein
MMRTTLTTLTGLGLLGATALASGWLGGNAAETRPGDIRELLDPTRVAATACGSARWAKNELFKPGVHLAALAARPAAAAELDELPILEGLGPRRLSVTTASETAQAQFDQGYAWLMGFNHFLAAAYFRDAQAADPTCAMCYWGEALALGPNINDVMHDTSVRPAFQAISTAMALKAGASEREQALIEALAVRYSADPAADRASLDAAYADAMAEVAERFPDDVEVLVLAAEAIMNTQPWDYWEVDGVTPKGRAGRLVELLGTALAHEPEHPHASHLYIHAVEASADPGRAEPYADRLGSQMPTAGHLVHMPAHIYYRVGRYQDSLAANIEAAAADETLFQLWEEAGPYRYGYYPHNVHFVLTSAQMAGAAAETLDAALKLEAVMSDEVAAQVGWIQAIKTAPFTAHAQFSDTGTILAIPDPGDAMPYVKAFWHYARGVALARDGEPAALEEAAAIEALRTAPGLDVLIEGYIPAPDILTLAANVVRAKAAAHDGDFAAAEGLLEEAVAIQAAIPYMEPPYWYYPVEQSLGAVALAAGDAEAAARHFQAALTTAPNNGWSLFGLHEAQRAKGDEAAAKVTAERLAEAWVGPDDLLALDRL